MTGDAPRTYPVVYSAVTLQTGSETKIKLQHPVATAPGSVSVSIGLDPG